jgi:predicted Na+-dependent transporter
MGIRLAGFLFRLRQDQRRTLFFAGGLRNISVAAAMAIQFFPETAALPAILGIVSQQTIAALMGKSLRNR